MNAPEPIIVETAEAVREAYPFAPGEMPSPLLTNPQYHSVDALSASGIKRLLQSPMHYRYDRDHPSESTPSQVLGTMVHMAVLEPAVYNTSVAVIPEDAPKRPTTVQLEAAKPSAKALESIIYWEKFDRENAGKEVLTRAEFDKVEAMAGAVRRHPFVAEFLCDGQPEHSFFWRDARLDIPSKCRWDFLRSDGIALDLKTCQDASPEGFARAAAQWRYHYQAAWYNNGHEHVRDCSLKAFVFVAVESIAPYGCGIYYCQPNEMAYGMNRCEEAMLLYKQATSTGFWRGYSEAVQPLRLPKWATTLVPST